MLIQRLGWYSKCKHVNLRRRLHSRDYVFNSIQKFWFRARFKQYIDYLIVWRILASLKKVYSIH